MAIFRFEEAMIEIGISWSGEIPKQHQKQKPKSERDQIEKISTKILYFLQQILWYIKV